MKRQSIANVVEVVGNGMKIARSKIGFISRFEGLSTKSKGNFVINPFGKTILKVAKFKRLGMCGIEEY